MLSDIQDRYWINQPSTLQPDHDKHGMLVLADYYLDKIPGDYVEVYDPDGEKFLFQIAKSSLSRGWPNHLRTKPVHFE